MFNTKRFGLYLARLRKGADMTQSGLADKLNLTRQAVSAYERGDSFPDVSILVHIADIFGVSLDELINSGEPTRGEAAILRTVAEGRENVPPQNLSQTDIANLAPFLKPSVLGKLSECLAARGIDISGVVSLAEYLSDDAVAELIENASFDSVSEELLAKLVPILDDRSKGTIFQKILEGEMDWRLIRIMIPYAENMVSLIEAAVVEGALPPEALGVMHEGQAALWEKRRKNDEI